MTSTKIADLAGPGIGTYQEVDAALPGDYRSLLDPKQTQKALFALKRFIEDGLNRELNREPRCPPARPRGACPCGSLTARTRRARRW